MKIMFSNYLDSKATSYSIKILFLAYIIFTFLSSYLSYFYGYYGGDLLTLQQAYTADYLDYFDIYIIFTVLFHYSYKITIPIYLKHTISNIFVLSSLLKFEIFQGLIGLAYSFMLFYFLNFILYFSIFLARTK